VERAPPTQHRILYKPSIRIQFCQGLNRNFFVYSFPDALKGDCQRVRLAKKPERPLRDLLIGWDYVRASRKQKSKPARQSPRHTKGTYCNFSQTGESLRMLFASRQDAGRQLGEFLRQRGIAADLVLGLPRGGVVVAAEVARELKLPLDVLVVRKIGHPWHREFAVGALAEPEVIIFDEPSLREIPVPRSQLDKVVAEETARLREYCLRFHHSGAPALAGKAVLLVDDGLATGATIEAAVLSARKQQVKRVVVAAPVASPNAVERLRRAANDVIVFVVDPDFAAVGQYYDEFSQTTDEEVIALLRVAAAPNR
jgi:predicted phosphoribosyltransferase